MLPFLNDDLVMENSFRSSLFENRSTTANQQSPEPYDAEDRDMSLEDNKDTINPFEYRGESHNYEYPPIEWESLTLSEKNPNPKQWKNCVRDVMNKFFKALEKEKFVKILPSRDSITNHKVMNYYLFRTDDIENKDAFNQYLDSKKHVSISETFSMVLETAIEFPKISDMCRRLKYKWDNFKSKWGGNPSIGKCFLKLTPEQVEFKFEYGPIKEKNLIGINSKNQFNYNQDLNEISLIRASLDRLENSLLFRMKAAGYKQNDRKHKDSPPFSTPLTEKTKSTTDEEKYDQGTEEYQTDDGLTKEIYTADKELLFIPSKNERDCFEGGFRPETRADTNSSVSSSEDEDDNKHNRYRKNKVKRAQEQTLRQLFLTTLISLQKKRSIRKLSFRSLSLFQRMTRKKFTQQKDLIYFEPPFDSDTLSVFQSRVTGLFDCVNENMNEQSAPEERVLDGEKKLSSIQCENPLNELNEESKELETKEEENNSSIWVSETNHLNPRKGSSLPTLITKLERHSLMKPIEFQPKESVVLIGNPGVGKSTILNSLLGKLAFKSGVSLGCGLTTVLQEEYDENGVRFIDTPGLSDIDMREKAAKEIEAALRKGGLYKIFFVITLESGRIKPDDKTTMKLVLEAADTIQHSYSVIINKVQDKVLKQLNDGDTKKAFLAKLNQGLPGTDKIFFNLFDIRIDAEKDARVKISQDFADFLLHVAPVLEIKKETVKDIEYNDFDKIRRVLGEQLEELQRNREMLQKMVAKQSEELIKMRQSQNQAQGAHADQTVARSRESNSICYIF